MTIHVGLIGGGNISRTHAGAVTAISGAKIAATWGTNADKTASLCREFGGRLYQDFDSFLAHRPMDLVIVGSPSGLHAQQGIACARAGLHVLVEKPIDISVQRANSLIAACEDANVKLGVIFQDRLKPGPRRVKELIAEGALGRLFLVDARVKWYRPSAYYGSSHWRGTWALDGGGALMNQGIHTVDLLLWLVGDIANVRARTETLFHDVETEDTALAVLKFTNGAAGILEATTATYPGYPRRLDLTGTEGTVVLEDDAIVSADLRSGLPGIVVGDSVTGAPSQAASSPVVADCRAHQRVIEDFIQAIQHDTTPVCDGREGRRSVAVVESIYRASGARDENVHDSHERSLTPRHETLEAK
jgi:UDP-N-acetyl-2-amino-2-deoxyglucuronate dehydrogenase